MEPEFRQLVHLLEISRAGSFSKAAEILRISQPALSNSIAQLERRLRAKVLERGRSGAALTDVGRTLIRHAEILTTQMTRAVEEVEGHQKSVLGPLRIAVTPVAAAEIVPRVIAELRKKYSNLNVDLFETVYSMGVDGLLKGSLDLMVGPIGVYALVPEIEECRLSKDPFVLAMRTTHPLGKKKVVALAELADADWVLPSDRSAFHKQLEALFVVAGVQWPVKAITTNSMYSMKSLVIHTNCLALMPRQLLEVERKIGLIKTVQLKEAGEARSLGVSWAKGRIQSSSAKDFVQIALKLANDGLRVPTSKAGVVR